MTRNTKDREAYVVVREFMTRGMGLKGLPLLVYARIYGFCERGEGIYYESKRRLAWILGRDARSIVRAFNALADEGLIFEEVDSEVCAKVRSRVYTVNWSKAEEAKRAIALECSQEDGVSPPSDGSPSYKGDGTSSRTLTECHPIPKRENKNF